MRICNQTSEDRMFRGNRNLMGNSAGTLPEAVQKWWEIVYQSCRRAVLSVVSVDADRIWHTIDRFFNKIFWPYVIFTMLYLGGHVLWAAINGRF